MLSALLFRLTISLNHFQCVDKFVKALVREEKDAKKKKKLAALALTKDEWDRLALFVRLLMVGP